MKSNSPFCSEDELIGMLDEAGLEVARSSILDYNLSAAPPLFALDP